MSIQILLGCALLLAAATVVVRSRSGATAPATADRLRRGMPEPAATVTVEAPTTSAFEPVLARVGALVRRLAPRRSTELLETRLAAADLQGSWSADQLLALKLVLLVVGFGLGLAFLSMKPGVMGFIFLGVFTLAGWRLPDIVAGSRADERKRAIELQLPDTMDQLTIAVEAGLGFEAAMARVARTGIGPLAAELRRTLQDIQLGV
ncbi:MAG TPA: hypothetical protein VEA78_07660, partial [Acidimicrobiales bacterium]|nr:hypothetical protein [Acidimicrobiales bacterium]